MSTCQWKAHEGETTRYIFLLIYSWVKMWNLSARAAENEKSQLVFRRASSSLSQLILAYFILEMEELHSSWDFSSYSADLKHISFILLFQKELCYHFKCHWWIPLELSSSSPLHITFFPSSTEPQTWTFSIHTNQNVFFVFFLI